jgi:hypothetical protein
MALDASPLVRSVVRKRSKIAENCVISHDRASDSLR